MLAAIRNHYPESSDRNQSAESKTKHQRKPNTEFDEKFLKASIAGNYQRLESMIQEGAEVNVSNCSGDTALIFAAERGHGQCVDLLINAGADVNTHGTNGSTSLILAVENGHDECVNSLIKAGACVNDRQNDIFKSTALMFAVRAGKNSLAKLLISAGANVNAVDFFGKTSLCIASEKMSKELVDTLVQSGANVNKIDRKGFSPLFYATFCDHCFYSLCKAGADVNISSNDGSTVLMELTKQYVLNKIEFVLKSGADVNACDKNDFTALLFAAKRNFTDCVWKLVEAGADVNARSKHGAIALMFAVRNDNPTCVNILLEAGADVNASITVPGMGNTPLIEAAAIGNTQFVRKLLQRNAKINVIDKNGYNALTRHLATQGSPISWEICWLLYVAGEKLIYGISRDRVPDYLKHNEIKLNFNHICRQAIRKHLLDVDPYSHLFGRIPRLGLPNSVTEYLLYELSLDDDEISYPEIVS